MRGRKQWAVVVGACVLAATKAVAADPTTGSASAGPPAPVGLAQQVAAPRTVAVAPPPLPRTIRPSPVPVRRVVLGRSRQHRLIVAYELGDPQLPSMLVVGCIHGNETSGVPIARWLVTHANNLIRAHVWVVPILNPDGVALNTRQNAAGVDLNRNFPYRWALRNRGTLQDSGPRALSEPEARSLVRLVLLVHPRYAVWFHQSLSVVDDSQGPPAVEALFSRALQLPERPLTDFRGSAVGWQDLLRPHSAFVVELPPGQLPREAVVRAGLAVVAAAHMAAKH